MKRSGQRVKQETVAAVLMRVESARTILAEAQQEAQLWEATRSKWEAALEALQTATPLWKKQQAAVNKARTAVLTARQWAARARRGVRAAEMALTAAERAALAVDIAVWEAQKADEARVQQSLARASRALDLLDVLVPKRVSAEEVGDALELIDRMLRDGRPAWWVYVKIVTTYLWVLLHAVQYRMRSGPKKIRTVPKKRAS